MSGLLDDLKRSTKYIPPYQLEEQLRNQAELVVEKSVILRKSEITLNLLIKGVLIDVVHETTDPSIEEIGVLIREKDEQALRFFYHHFPNSRMNSNCSQMSATVYVHKLRFTTVYLPEFATNT